MTTLVMRFLADDAGATAIEYGLIAAGIAVAIIATVQALGTNLNTTFSTVSTVIEVDLRCRFATKAPGFGRGLFASLLRRTFVRARQRFVHPKFNSLKKSLPLSSMTMKAGKSTTSMRQIASMPSSGYSRVSTFLMQCSARLAAAPPIEAR